MHNNLSSNETWTVSVKAVHRRHRRQASYNKFMITNSSTKSSLTKSYSSSSSRRSGLQQSSLQQEELEEFICNKLINKSDFQAVHQHRAHRRAVFSSTPSTTKVQLIRKKCFNKSSSRRSSSTKFIENKFIIEFISAIANNKLNIEQ